MVIFHQPLIYKKIVLYYLPYLIRLIIDSVITPNQVLLILMLKIKQFSRIAYFFIVHLVCVEISAQILRDATAMLITSFNYITLYHYLISYKYVIFLNLKGVEKFLPTSL